MYLRLQLHKQSALALGKNLKLPAHQGFYLLLFVSACKMSIESTRKDS